MLALTPPRLRACFGALAPRLRVRCGALALCLLVLAAGGACTRKQEPDEGALKDRLGAALDPCAEGGSDFAKTVCEDEALAVLDAQVRENLVAEAASVSDAGAQMLVQNEQRWREAQRVACGIADPALAPDAEQQACLEASFRGRVADTQGAVEQVGGYTFQRVEIVDAEPMSEAIASAAGFGLEDAPAKAITRDIRFPRIDAPQTPQIRRFNELVAQQPQFRLEDGVEEVVNYTIAYAGPALISVRFDLMDSSLAQAHPNSSSNAVTELMQEGRPLTAGDVFDPGTRWQDFIARSAQAALTAQFKEYEFAPPARDVRESATKAHLWLITDKALVILFPPYSFGGPHALGGAEVSIPWTDLTDYLAATAPAPIRPQT